MKIIKLGEIPKCDRYPKERTCNYCKTVFEYDIKDIHYNFREGDYVICPNNECKKFINVVNK